MASPLPSGRVCAMVAKRSICSGSKAEGQQQIQPIAATTTKLPATKRQRRRIQTLAEPERTRYSCSPATGLPGLRESRFLSSFLEHYTGMYPIANDQSVRDGLIHEFVRCTTLQQQRRQQQQQQQQQRQQSQPQQWQPPQKATGLEEMKGQALSCALFSCMAVGGLVMGCPPSSVELYTASAKHYLPGFKGLSDESAVSALIVYAMANEYLTGRGAGTEYRTSMDSARAALEKMPKKQRDPIISAVLSHFMVLEGFPMLQHVEASCSVNPVNNSSRGGRGGGGIGVINDTNSSGCSSNSDGIASSGGSGNSDNDDIGSGRCTSYICAQTEDQEATFQEALAFRQNLTLVPGQAAPPVYVVVDALLLGIRFSKDRGDVSTRLNHLHNFASAELDRFKADKAGTVALLALSGALLGVKIRLGLLSDTLATAKVASTLIHACPGLARIYHCHAAHLSMAVFRLHGCTEEYESLRGLLARTTGDMTPAFEDMLPSKRLCAMEVCKRHTERLLSV